MSENKYWGSFAELNNKEAYQKLSQDEFQEDLPAVDGDGKGFMDASTPRRDFLKYVGFSTAAATVAASCNTPVRKAIPYVNRPENIVPGVAKFYATTYVQDGDVVPLVVKVRDGRPIKIEGNDLSSLTKGGTSARVQASVLDLYDMYRTKNPMKKNGGDFAILPSFDVADQQIGAGLASARSVVLLTSTITSPSTKQIIASFLSRYPGSRHVQYDAMSSSALLQANGGRVPAYRFDKAKVIVSLGADFLGTWISPVEFASQYAVNRKINDQNPMMSKHFQFESFLSMTGANADERYTHTPSETGKVALALLAALGSGTAPQLDAKLSAGIQAAGAALRAAGGAALVVSGSNDVNVQTVVAAINAAIGSSAIESGTYLNYRQGNDADFVKLVQDMNAGAVGALLVYGANPVYDYFDPAAFKTAMSKVPMSVSFSEKLDETSELCQYLIPTHHFLESWGDAEPKSGYISFLQPTINPLFKTRYFQTSLLKWSGQNTNYETYFRTYWTGRLGGQAGLDKALQDGILENGKAPVATNAIASAPIMSGPAASDSLTQAPAVVVPVAAPPAPAQGPGLAAATAALASAPASGKEEVVLYQGVALGTGRQAGNPWLLELPDPITKLTWDNCALISVDKAKALGIDYETVEYEYYTDKPTIEISVPGREKVVLPVLVLPGMNKNTIAIAVGYGRSEKFAKATQGVGKNVYQFARWNGSNIVFDNAVTTSAKTIDVFPLAQSQKHNSYEDRIEVLRETTMGTFLQNPDEIKEWREELHKEFVLAGDDYANNATLYYPEQHSKPGLKWGMSIDLNSCIGCGACVIACHSENNVPVVGKNEVLRFHDMAWMRIDRYFVSDRNDQNDLKSVVFQPMLCQHCDNAPCENVCPVAATMHNAEGVNQMAYNRCIGTRYCANNCPYKVRRFNWSDYTGASTHGVMGPSSGVGKLNDAVHQMNDELTRMVLNPDVVTRSRGVMEKCSFCVQRTQEGKLRAKEENRPLGSDEVKSACAQACPTNAIVFGNANDAKSAVSQIRSNSPRRLFYALEQIHTMPNVSYLAKVRNTAQPDGRPRHEAAAAHGETEHAGAAHEEQHH